MYQQLPIKRHGVADWIKKKKQHEPTICCLQEAPLWAKDAHRIK